MRHQDDFCRYWSKELSVVVKRKCYTPRVDEMFKNGAQRTQYGKNGMEQNIP